MTVSEQIIEVINTLCDKIGIVVNDVTELIPSFARYGVATHAAIAIFCGVCLVLAAGLLVVLFKLDYINFKTWRAYEENWHNPKPQDLLGINIVGAALILVVVFPIGLMFIDTLIDLVGWVAAPEVKMIYEILDLLP